MSRVSRKVHDRCLLRLIGRYLRAGVMVEGVLQPTPEGAPQGGPLSPLLSNILLDDLDKELEHRGLRFVRYADDFQIFVRSERSAQRVFASVQRYLTQRLKLVVNEQKSSVGPALGCEYLGFTFVGKRVTIKHAISRKSYWRMSRTPAMRYAMPNKWLAEQGLLSLKQLWCDRAPLRGIA